MIELNTCAIFMFWAFAFDSLICELGQRVTNRYEAYGDELCKCDWYSLPVKLQRLYLIFLLDTQQPKRIQSYGGIVCSRKTFKKVVFLIMKKKMRDLCMPKRKHTIKMYCHDKFLISTHFYRVFLDEHEGSLENGILF